MKHGSHRLSETLGFGPRKDRAPIPDQLLPGDQCPQRSQSKDGSNAIGGSQLHATAEEFDSLLVLAIDWWAYFDGRQNCL